MRGLTLSIYQNIGLKRVVNASGRVTKLGVSTISDKVAAAAVEGASSYVVIDDLIDRAGELIAEHTGAEGACVTSCASAALALSIAGLVTRGQWTAVYKLPDPCGAANEVVLQKGHSIDFGAPIQTMIRLGGGCPVECGQANEVHPEDIEEAITDKTVCLLYVKSHHCVQKGMVDIETMRDIAHAHNLPFVMDCAAEEDFRKYIALGADIVCYSGAKALEATTSGFMCGKREYAEWAKHQYHGVGRAMKVGKEQIMGLLAALDQYEARDHAAEVEVNVAKIDWLVNEINQIRGLHAEKIQDEAGRAIFRCRITFDSEAPAGLTMEQVNEKLVSGDPIVWARTEFLNLGKIDFDPRPMLEGDKELIVEVLKQIMEG